jgi:gliding-associated putative ABC transporter substrate-binding component GldG
MKPDVRNRNEVTFFLILAGILVLLNLISVRNFFRIDLTKNQAYSLSKTSKTYMQGLKDNLTVKAFFTKNLPAPYNANARYLRDLLEDYRTYSHGHFNYQFVDPADDPALANEARTLGIYGIQFTDIEKDKFEQKNGYMGVAFMYRDKKEIIPLLQDTNGLEYQLTSMIKKLIQEQTKVVGITQGFGEAVLGQDLDNFRQLISKNYEVVPVDLANGPIPDRVDTLVVAGPTQPIPDDKLYALDQFLRSGKNMAVMARMVKADARQSMQGQAVNSGLDRLLAAWGVQMHPDLVYDMQCQKITVAQRGPGFVIQNIVPYPPFPLVTELDRSNLIVRNLESITLPFVSSVTLNEGLLKNNHLEAAFLAKSSPKAWEQQGFFMLSPQYIGAPQPNDLKQFGLAATLSGTFPSLYAPDRLPKPGKDPLAPFIDKAKPSRLLVIGSADFLSNDFLDPRRGGTLVQFAQNLVDWTAQDSELVEIRSKGVEPAVLGNVPEAQRMLVKYFNLAGLPILVVIAGLLMWRRMEARRQMVAELFKTQA